MFRKSSFNTRDKSDRELLVQIDKELKREEKERRHAEKKRFEEVKQEEKDRRKAEKK